MSRRDDARRRVERLFRGAPVQDLPALERAVRTNSRSTVFRVLSDMGYLSSCSHAGRYYTLDGLPEFDEDGLWTHGGALFSKYRTLRETIVRLVEESPAGRTHAELQERLRLRVQDTLRDLADARRIDRTQLARLYVYVSIERATAQRQIKARRDVLAKLPTPEVAPALATVVEILLELVHGAGAWMEPGALAKRLGARGITVSPEQVEQVYRDHGIVKKGAHSRLPSSPR